MKHSPEHIRFNARSVSEAISEMLAAGVVGKNEPFPWDTHKALLALRNMIQRYERTICGGCEECPAADGGDFVMPSELPMPPKSGGTVTMIGKQQTQ